MDDRFLTESRREPEPGFARSLRERLRATESAAEVHRRPRWQPALAAALAVAAGVAVFTVPAVRVTAQQLLNMFRVRDFAVVQINESRMQELKARKIDPETLLGGRVEKLQEPGPSQRFTSIEAATAAAGFTPLKPAILPRGLTLDSVFVMGELRERVTVDTKPLRELMDAFNVRDLTLPSGLDGQQVSIWVPRVMVQTYRNERKAKAALVQAGSPEVSLPPGIELARLGEIGLRLLGLDAGEAARMARTIDWGSTMLVPVIGSATTFQEVTVNGVRGVYIETTSTHTEGGEDQGPGGVVMWSREGRVYAMMGNVDRAILVTMAESVH